MSPDEQRAWLEDYLKKPPPKPLAPEPAPGPRLWPWAVAALAALAALWSLWPSKPAPSPVPQAQAPAVRPLEARLAAVGWSMARGLDPGPTRRLDPPVALVGAEHLDDAPWFVLLTIRNADGSDSHCGGTLLAPVAPGAPAAVLTAAHCVTGEPWRQIDVAIAPTHRSEPGRALYVVTSAAYEAEYEGRNSMYRHDRALIILPDDPGGGIAPPEGPWAEVAPGMAVEVVGMGLDEAGRLSDQLKRVRLPIVEARPGIVRLDGSRGGFREADSGGPVILRLTDGRVLPVGVISHYDGGDPTRQWIMPIKIGAITAALKEMIITP